MALKMAQQYDIKNMYLKQGKSLKSIARETGHCFKTVQKYAMKTDYSTENKPNTIRRSKLEPFKETIDKWLESDQSAPPKQRHTARRIYHRLQEIYPDIFKLKERTVANYVGKQRKLMTTGESVRKSGMLHLKHFPGEAQLDFGAVTYYHNGEEIKGNHLVISFPYSNHSYAQLFPSQNQESLFQGMKNIFEYIGGVPKEIWFDNMSTAVAQVKSEGKRVLTDAFKKFTLHYGYEPKFCNPASGNEKGHVECKVGFTRRNHMVPVPQIESLETFNKWLLNACDKDSESKHYLKGVPIKELFLEERSALLPLNTTPYEVSKIEYAKTNNMGYVWFKGNHYSVLPNYKKQNVWIRSYSEYIEVLTEDYVVLTTHKRSYKKHQKITHWKDWEAVLVSKINAIKHTEFYQELPKTVQEHIDSKVCPKEKRELVSELGKIIFIGDIEIVTEALRENLSKNISDTASLLVTYRALKNPHKKVVTMELKEQVPMQKAYIPQLEIYDSLLQGGVVNATIRTVL